MCARLSRACRIEMAVACAGGSATDSVTDVSRDTGVPRSTLYGIIGKVRAAFKDAGLEDYL